MGRPGPTARRRASASRRSLGPDTSTGGAHATHGLEPTAQALESTHSPAATGAGVLTGNTFALSATGESQGALAALITAGGGTVVKIVNSSVDYVVATPLAVRRRTQAVRKARDKFGVPLVLPAFIRDALATGALGDAAAYEPRADAVVKQEGRPASSASLASLGLKPGSAISVLVEMSDDPVEQWWPTAVHPNPSPHPATVHPTPSAHPALRRHPEPCASTPSPTPRTRCKRPPRAPAGAHHAHTR